MKVLGKKEHEIRQSCMACGYCSLLDQKHRLAIYIIKNPPPEDEKTEKAMKAQAQKGKAAAVEAAEGEEDVEGMGDADGVDGSEDAADGAGLGNGVVVPEPEWVDGGEAVAEGEELTDAMKALVVDPDADLPIAERLDKFLHFIQAKMEAGGLPALEGRAVIAESERLDLDKEKATLILGRALFTPDNVLNTIPKARNALLRFTHENKKAQR